MWTHKRANKHEQKMNNIPQNSGISSKWSLRMLLNDAEGTIVHFRLFLPQIIQTFKDLVGVRICRLSFLSQLPFSTGLMLSFFFLGVLALFISLPHVCGGIPTCHKKRVPVKTQVWIVPAACTLAFVPPICSEPTHSRFRAMATSSQLWDRHLNIWAVKRRPASFN